MGCLPHALSWGWSPQPAKGPDQQRNPDLLVQPLSHAGWADASVLNQTFDPAPLLLIRQGSQQVLFRQKDFQLCSQHLTAHKVKLGFCFCKRNPQIFPYRFPRINKVCRFRDFYVP